MSIYERRERWKIYLLAVALLIVVSSLIYTNILARKIADEERKKVELWASAYKHLNLASDTTDISFLFEVITNNESVPVILADQQGQVKAWRNIDTTRAINDPDYLQEQLEEMQASREPILIEISEDQFNYIYYKDSFLLSQLRYYPFAQLGIIAVFLLVAYFAINTARSAEQNKVWVGMAKETAHQLGTPISSLAAWIEYFRETGSKISPDVLIELEKDVNRLELVAERFSKIGSKPDLVKTDITDALASIVEYMKKRSSEKVIMDFKSPPEPVIAPVNKPLFEWVVENLLKNALDAIEGNGKIFVNLEEEDSRVIIDVRDTGKGISKAKFSTVFEPGFSTKKRGWGLGLTLTKRIVESYHAGKIFVKESTIGQGTTFRIILPKKA